MAYSLRTSPVAQSDQNRADFLEWLYFLDGRDDVSHPRHHTYTGLYEATVEAVGRRVLEHLQEAWHEQDIPDPADGLMLSADLLLEPERRG